MIGTRSWTPVDLPGGYGEVDNDGWFDCRGTSGWLNPNCYGPGGAAIRMLEDTEDAVRGFATQGSGNTEKAEKPPAPGYDPYKKTPAPGYEGGGKSIPWGTIIPVGVGVMALAGALLFATRKK